MLSCEKVIVTVSPHKEYFVVNEEPCGRHIINSFSTSEKSYHLVMVIIR